MGKFKDYKYGILGLVVLFVGGAFTNFGNRLTVWSTPTKKGLLPYEAPSIKAFTDMLIEDAFAS